MRSTVDYIDHSVEGGDGVVSSEADETIRAAKATVDDVVACLEQVADAEDVVDAVATGDGVVSGAAVDDVGSGWVGDGVIFLVAEQ